jgi:hypothetical protein
MKITFLTFLSPLLEQLKQKQVKANVTALFQRVIRDKSIQMWRLAETKNEYNNFHNLVNGTLKNTVDVEKLNRSLLLHQVSKHASRPSLSLIYDGSDLRKGESEKLEHLGWVKSLSGSWIRGYSSFNSIVLDRANGVLGLLSSIPYSNRDPQFLSEKESKLFEKNKIEDAARHQEIETYLENEDTYNQKTIYFSSIRTNHEHFKAQNPLVELTHILDRGHDDAALFELIDQELKDKLVIRIKGSRNSSVQAFNEVKQKEMFVKLGVVKFAHRAEKTYGIRFKSTPALIILFESAFLTIKGSLFSKNRC